MGKSRYPIGAIIKHKETGELRLITGEMIGIKITRPINKLTKTPNEFVASLRTRNEIKKYYKVLNKKESAKIIKSANLLYGLQL